MHRAYAGSQTGVAGTAGARTEGFIYGQYRIRRGSHSGLRAARDHAGRLRDATVKIGLIIEDAKIGTGAAFIVFERPGGGDPICVDVTLRDLNEAVRKVNEQYDRLKLPGMS